MTKTFKTLIAASSALGVVAIAATAAAHTMSDMPPGSKFDLSQWNITLPVDENKDGKVDSIKVADLQDYTHPDFFYLSDDGRMVFVSPNKGTTTKNTSNARSELRHMLRGKNTRYKTHGPENNFAVEARKGSKRFGRVGGKMEATLRVEHVAKNAGNPKKGPAYSVVVGQIHAVKYDNTTSGFGYGNEPIKIYFKKFPGHEYGSVFWNYERNLAKDDPERKDINIPIWGNGWDNPAEPGEAGIKLGEEFSYTINVYRNTMYLTFETERHGTVRQSVSLVSPFDAKDNKYSYGGDSLYFKAGVYNQCSTKTAPGVWYAGCGGTGDWETDKANGDYAQASFSRLVTSESTAPEGAAAKK